MARVWLELSHRHSDPGVRRGPHVPMSMLLHTPGHPGSLSPSSSPNIGLQPVFWSPEEAGTKEK